MITLLKSKKSNAEINKIMANSATKYSEENKILKRINSLLSRKDVVDLENEKVDTLRLLLFHLENKKEMSVTNLVKFLKA